MDSFLKILIRVVIFGLAIIGPIALGTIVVLGVLKAFHKAE